MSLKTIASRSSQDPYSELCVFNREALTYTHEYAGEYSGSLSWRETYELLDRVLWVEWISDNNGPGFWDNLALKSYSKYTDMMDMLELGKWKCTL